MLFRSALRQTIVLSLAAGPVLSGFTYSYGFRLVRKVQ